MRSMNQKMMNGLRRCSYCGARILMQGYNIQSRLGHIVNTRCMCYDCAFWLDLQKYPPSHMEVIDSVCYKIYPEGDKRDKTTILGGKGKMKYYMRKDRSVFRSNDVWLIGSIPHRFRSLFPNTAQEITAKAYNSLNNNSKMCKARGCFDRYNCIRYNLSLEDDDIGAYNKPPANWKIGNERCRYFINAINIITDESSNQ